MINRDMVEAARIAQQRQMPADFSVFAHALLGSLGASIGMSYAEVAAGLHVADLMAQLEAEKQPSELSDSTEAS